MDRQTDFKSKLANVVCVLAVLGAIGALYAPLFVQAAG
jgi:hypothetical protein